MINTQKIPNTNTYRIVVAGKIDEDTMEHLAETLEAHKETHQPLRVLFVMPEMPGFEDFEAFGETLKMKSAALQKGARYALVTDKKWMEKPVPVGDFLTPGIVIKHFHIAEEREAIDWLEGAKPESE